MQTGSWWILDESLQTLLGSFSFCLSKKKEKGPRFWMTAQNRKQLWLSWSTTVVKSCCKSIRDTLCCRLSDKLQLDNHTRRCHCYTKQSTCYEEWTNHYRLPAFRVGQASAQAHTQARLPSELRGTKQSVLLRSTLLHVFIKTGEHNDADSDHA
jgi:hypothetical protein